MMMTMSHSSFIHSSAVYLLPYRYSNLIARGGGIKQGLVEGFSIYHNNIGDSFLFSWRADCAKEGLLHSVSLLRLFDLILEWNESGGDRFWGKITQMKLWRDSRKIKPREQFWGTLWSGFNGETGNIEFICHTSMLIPKNFPSEFLKSDRDTGVSMNISE